VSRDLEELRKVLIEGLRRTMQGSYMRREPASEAIPFLLEARSGLKQYVREHEKESDAWRMLSQAEESLLNYAAALRCLERAMSNSGRKDKKDLKKLAQLKEYEGLWASLNLSPPQLAELGNHLSAKLEEQSCDHTLRFTKEWLEVTNVANVKSVIQGLRSQGGFCDCEVLNNVALG
jgi:hypothetical protein